MGLPAKKDEDKPAEPEPPGRAELLAFLKELMAKSGIGAGLAALVFFASQMSTAPLGPVGLAATMMFAYLLGLFLEPVYVRWVAWNDSLSSREDSRARIDAKLREQDIVHQRLLNEGLAQELELQRELKQLRGPAEDDRNQSLVELKLKVMEHGLADIQAQLAKLRPEAEAPTEPEPADDEADAEAMPDAPPATTRPATTRPA